MPTLCKANGEMETLQERYQREADAAKRHHDETACRQAYDNRYHKIRAAVGYDEFRAIWFKALESHEVYETEPQRLADIGRLIDEHGITPPPPDAVAAQIAISAGLNRTDAEALVTRVMQHVDRVSRAAIESDRREYLDTLKLARAIVNGHRRDNPPEDSVGADQQGRMPSDEKLPDLFREALSWGRAWGRTISPQDWDELRDDQVAQLLSRYSSGQPETGKTVLVENQAVTGQPAASAEHQQLCEFYDVLTDDELIDAQQRHIEKLQAKLLDRDPFPGRVREG